MQTAHIDIVIAPKEFLWRNQLNGNSNGILTPGKWWMVLQKKCFDILKAHSEEPKGASLFFLVPQRMIIGLEWTELSMKKATDSQFRMETQGAAASHGLNLHSTVNFGGKQIFHKHQINCRDNH